MKTVDRASKNGFKVKPAKLPTPAEVKAVGLRYVSDMQPGIERKKTRSGFAYTSPGGEKVKDAKTLHRIKALVIPPAWTEVWICPIANGHLQATGRDAKGRKQYRYHAAWRAMRDDNKYGRMLSFGQALPRIRERVEHDLNLRGMPREKVLATIVRLLETTLIRVGNEEYAKENGSFGLTTMRNRHVQVEGTVVHFKFKGKSGIKHSIDLKDRKLASIVKRCRELPGQDLFEYLDENDQPQTISSTDVNAYLHEISGGDYTAKDFRTWAGTMLAALALQELEAFDSQTQAKRNVTQAIESVAKRLGNTPTVCRKCYVHPEVLNAYLDGTMLETLKQNAQETLAEELSSLRPEEAAVMALLQKRLQREVEKEKQAA